jgi:hypothetical protein
MRGLVTLFIEPPSYYYIGFLLDKDRESIAVYITINATGDRLCNGNLWAVVDCELACHVPALVHPE